MPVGTAMRLRFRVAHDGPQAVRRPAAARRRVEAAAATATASADEPPEARAGGHPRLRDHLHARLDAERAEDVRHQGQRSPGQHLVDVAALGLGERVLRLDADAGDAGLDAAPGPAVDGDVDRDRTRVEQVERPDVEGAAGQVDAGRRGGLDDTVRRVMRVPDSTRGSALLPCGSMACPRCGFDGGGAPGASCARCGVVFAKMGAARPRPAPPATPPCPRIRAGRDVDTPGGHRRGGGLRACTRGGVRPRGSPLRSPRRAWCRSRPTPGRLRHRHRSCQ